MTRAIPELGTLVAGKYRVTGQLGEGGMGVVWLAVHEPLGVKVAVKVLSAQGRTPTDERRFLHEAQATAQLKSAHIARVSDFGALDDGRQFMVLEHLEGEDLGAIVERRGRLDPKQAVDLVIQACAGLAEAHAAGIVHRDMKPSNLFLTHASDGTPLLKVLDFGVSKFTGGLGQAPHITSGGLAVGTPLYMSPEQVKAQPVDLRADVWALGVVLYELVSGVAPFFDESLGMTLVNVVDRPHAPLSTHVSSVDRGLVKAIDACLQKLPEKRPESVAALAEILAPFATADGQRLASRVRAIGERARSRESLALTPSTRPPDKAKREAVEDPLGLAATKPHLTPLRSDALGADVKPGSTPYPARVTRRSGGARGVAVAIAVALAPILVGAVVWLALSNRRTATPEENEADRDVANEAPRGRPSSAPTVASSDAMVIAPATPEASASASSTTSEVPSPASASASASVARAAQPKPPSPPTTAKPAASGSAKPTRTLH